MRWSSVVLAAASVVAVSPRGVSAQAMPPADEAIDIQNFSYSIGPKTFFSVDNASLADKGQLTLDAMITYLIDPLVIYNTTNNGTSIGTTRDSVVRNVTQMQLSGAYGLTEKLQLGANLPFIFSLQGDGLDPATGQYSANGLQVTWPRRSARRGQVPAVATGLDAPRGHRRDHVADELRERWLAVHRR